tara:strand:+ start:416 stop:613 length:198 start_codon:yes stop_codon:yes gene_type:complete
MSDTFEYSREDTYENNFNRWYGMNSKERLDNKQEPYSIIVGKRVFNEIYGKESVKEKIANLIKDK